MTRVHALLFSLTLVAMGCDPAVSTCRRAASCNDEDASECVDDVRAGRSDAKESGCLPEYDALSACTAQNSECTDNGFVIDLAECGSETGDLLQCELSNAF